MGMLATSPPQAVLLAAALVAIVGLSSAAPSLTLRINGFQAPINLDTLVDLGSSVSLTCNDDGTSVTGDLFFNDINATTYAELLNRQSDGTWIIESMSIEHQGAYRCCVQTQCEVFAVITVPQDTTAQVIAAEGEQPTLSCPLEIAKGFSQHYHVQWRVPVDVTVAESGSGGKEPQWASLNDNTLELTVGPLNSTLPRVFECVVLSFTRGLNEISFSNSPKGTLNIVIPTMQQLQVAVSPSVIAFGSNGLFNVSCGTRTVQALYNAKYQFFDNGVPIGAPSSSSFIMAPATRTGNFTCNVTQYSDLGTPIPSQQSPPLQATVLNAPRLSGGSSAIDIDCIQEVTVSLQEPVPDEMFYTFSSVQTDSCESLRGMQRVDIATDKSEQRFAVNVGDSGLDTRERIYLISWYVMDGTMGPCSEHFPLQRTATACPPSPELLSDGAIAGIVVAIFGVLVVIVILLMCAAYKQGFTKGLMANLCKA